MFVDVACGNMSHMYVDFWCLSLYCALPVDFDHLSFPLQN